MSAEPKNRRRECPGCAGNGQISFFKGVSRFLISSEECPECSGMGYLLEDDNQAAGGENKKTIKKNQKSKTKKS